MTQSGTEIETYLARDALCFNVLALAGVRMVAQQVHCLRRFHCESLSREVLLYGDLNKAFIGKFNSAFESMNHFFFPDQSVF